MSKELTFLTVILIWFIIGCIGAYQGKKEANKRNTK